jgi:tetratricopeptide (TPR) repeat protein
LDTNISTEQFNKANALYQQGNYRAALDILLNLNAAFPDDKNIVYARARCHAKLGELRIAIKLSTFCIERWDSSRAKNLLVTLAIDANENKLPDTDSPIPLLNIERSSTFSAPRSLPQPPRKRRIQVQ